ncbi:MAG TPA: phospholipase D-like domain-containing protein [Vicinamibacterales bacterium]|nr:phospholipase D-like domain-containing protein [Vicinamibacterales bacterium]
MRLPKPRTVLYGLLIVGLLISVGLLIAQDEETLRVRTPIDAEDPRFPDYLARLVGRPITSGDAYSVLRNGDQTFPAMLRAIESARHRISFETYIYSHGKLSGTFTAALAAAARRGVTVQIVLDSMGASDSGEETIKQLKDAGCQVAWFNPVSHFNLEEINYRTHRKILAVDGEVAFIGGIGLADHWAGKAEGPKNWRDTQFEVHGPAVDNIEAGFHENWIETGGIVEPIVRPTTGPPAGDARSVVVWSASQGGPNALKLMYLLAIGAARKTLDIQSPYLITDESTMWSLFEARKRGVRVRLLSEGDVTDAKPVKFAARADYESMLEHGIEIYEYQPTMMHTKAFIADGAISIVGSANFDNRSLELNDELNVLVASRTVASELTGDFERDLARSKRFSLDEWRRRPVHIRAREKLWGFFGEIF